MRLEEVAAQHIFLSLTRLLLQSYQPHPSFQVKNCISKFIGGYMFSYARRNHSPAGNLVCPTGYVVMFSLPGKSTPFTPYTHRVWLANSVSTPPSSIFSVRLSVVCFPASNVLMSDFSIYLADLPPLLKLMRPSPS